MKASKFRLLFFGSDKFSIRVLKHLLESKICPIDVVARPNNLLDKFSARNHLRRYKWPLEPTITYNHEEPFNIGLVASFGHLIEGTTVNLFKYGLFNVHPSLLPQYRGSTPIQAAILDGIPETGCTIMRIPPIAKFDIGEIVLQERMAIKNREYALELADRLADLGSSLAVKLLLDYENCISNTRTQSEEGRSLARKIRPEQGLLSFKKEDSKLIDRKVRAYTGSVELFAFCLNGLRIRLEGLRDPEEVEGYDLDRLASRLLKAKQNVIDNTADVQAQAGLMFFHKLRRVVCIKCSDDKWLAFDHLTPEFRPRMSAFDFYNGYLSKFSAKDRKTDN